MSDARQAIAAAREANAEEFAGAELAIARDLLNKAEKHIRSREYTSARRNAIASRAKAVEARRVAEAMQSREQQ